MMAVIGVFVGAVVLALFTRRLRREDDMGSVSLQWLSEYRQTHES